MYICICVYCYSSRLVYSVCTEHQQYSTHSKIHGRVYVFPFRVDFFLPCDQGLEIYITIFSLSLENEQADAGPDGRTHLARPNSQARTGTDRKIFIFSVQLTTSRIGSLTRS